MFTIEIEDGREAFLKPSFIKMTDKVKNDR